MKANLLEYDFLSYSPQLLFLNKTRASSLIGTVFSLLCSIAILALGVLFLKDSIDRKKYFLSSADEVVGKANYTLKDFDLVFDLRDGQGRSFANFSRLVSYIAYQDVVGSPKIERCSPQSRGISDTGTKYNIQGELLCLESSYDYNLHKYGDGSYLGLLLMPCVNATLPKDADRCYPMDFIRSTLTKDEMFVYMIIKDRTINHTSLTEIFPIYENMIILKFNMDIMLRYQLKFQPITYNIDHGYVFEETRQQQGYVYTGMDFQVDLTDFTATFPKFAHIDILLDPSRRTYNRSYIKLQAVAANIGGVAKFCLLIGQSLVYLYSYNLFYVQFARAVFTSNSSASSNSFDYFKSKALENNEGNVNLNNVGLNNVQSFVHNNQSNHNASNVNSNNNISNEIIHIPINNLDLKLGTRINEFSLNRSMHNYSTNVQAVKFSNDLSNVIKNDRTDQTFQHQLKSLWAKRSKMSEGIRLTPSIRDYFFFCKSKSFEKLVKNTRQILAYENLVNNIAELVSYKNYYSCKEDLIYFGNGIDYSSFVSSDCRMKVYNEPENNLLDHQVINNNSRFVFGSMK